ncbi:unnamed protein product [Ectocarpus sp. CCAP 1310/34]|nr:unnamed protein product [Ectocarpus sp. CCAP 1310/34]
MFLTLEARAVAGAGGRTGAAGGGPGGGPGGATLG